MKKITLIACALSVTAAVSAQQQVVQPLKSGRYFTMPSGIAADEYLPKTIIVKVLPQFRSYCTTHSIDVPLAQQFFAALGVNSVEKIFPNHQKPAKDVDQYGRKLVDLSLTYTIKYTNDYELEKAINYMQRTGAFEYSQPYYIPKAIFTPNDPQATQASSYHIYKVKAASTSGLSGWDISTGSASVVIGITDTGTELTHSDLTNQIAYNTADPINGTDDDNDGFIDNYRGWDVGMNDNDPTWEGNAHGVHVSGCAAAQVNNNTGVAGTGYNCKFLPVKIADASGTLIASYQGITYAADHGCKVINCSWGGTGGGPFGQSVIDYATINKDALVVAAAGNNAMDQAFYPAAFDKVLSVAATSSNDLRASFTNWNYTVDVCAPGNNINATWTGNSYTTQSGTSMASPVTAGCAAIVRSYFPSYNALQAGEQLKMTTDYIYNVGSNSGYIDKLGTGRVNLYNALTSTSVESVVFTNKVSVDNNDNTFLIGDTLRITGDFINYLAATTNLTATLTAVSGAQYVTILDGSTTPGAIASNTTTNNNTDPFQVKILPATPANQSITFKLALSDGSYAMNYYFTEIVNVDYINIAINDVSSTVTSKGLIGYNMDGQQQGLGFTYMNSGSLMYESAVMMGTSSTLVNDMARGTGATPDVDFASQVAVHRNQPAVVSDFDCEGFFRDNVSTTPLPVTVHHQAYAWSSPPHTKYIIFQYVIQNTGASTLSNFYSGIFADWDIDATTYADNKSAYDATNKMGYSFHTAASGLYCGIKLLTSSAPANFYAIDNISGGGGGVDLFTNGYDSQEKYTTLSTMRTTAGGAGTGNDVCNVMSTGPYTINANDSIIVAFALIAGDDLADLQNSAVDAQNQYDNAVPLGVQQAITHDRTLTAFPNPTNGVTNFVYNLDQPGTALLRLFDMSGRAVATLASGDQASGEHRVSFDTSVLPSGMYFYRLETTNGTVSRKLVLTR